MNRNQPLPPEVDPEDEKFDQEPAPGKTVQDRSGTSAGTWIAVFGSSAMFHVLLLILLGMIVISEPDIEDDHFVIEPPEQESEKAPEIREQPENKKPVKRNEKPDRPEVDEPDQTKEPDKKFNQNNEKTIFELQEKKDEKSGSSISIGEGSKDGPFGPRNPGDAKTLPPGDGHESREAVDAALTWLARHQSEDGHWDVDNYTKQCPEENRCEKFVEDRSNTDVGVTGLAVLAFLGAGYTQETGKRLNGFHMGSVVKNALRWLKDQQKDNGMFHRNSRQMYSHALATMAFAEAYGMTEDPLIEEHAQDAVDFLQKAQNENEDGELLAWRYGPNSGDNDTSVAGWCVMALKSADLAGLETSQESIQGGLRWVNRVTNRRGLTGYDSKPQSRSEAIRRRSMTPVGMLMRMFAYDNQKMTKERLTILRQGAEFVVNNPPEWQEDASFGGHGHRNMDYYYWYYGSLSLFMFAGPDTRYEKLGYWDTWNAAMQRAVLSGIQSEVDGHEMGSWDPVSRWANRGGRPYVTALNTLTLEVYYRYENALFQ